MNIHLQNKEQECKIDPVTGWVLVVRGRVNGEGKRG
jgi:hypothetical protein